MQLRPYQAAAVDATYNYLRTREGNPCVVIPTAGGKTPILSRICQDVTTKWNGRVAILAHVKELIEQAHGTLNRMGVDAGLYSAGLGKRDLDTPVVAAGIQSIYKKACDLGPVNLVLVDEAHLIPPGTDGDGMYQQFLTDCQVVNPDVRVVGLTATPFRMKSGMICEPGSFLNEICYEVGVRELIADGYLCPPVSKNSTNSVDTSKLHIRAGEFIESEMEALLDVEAHVIAACDEIMERAADRQSILIFAASVRHGLHIQRVIQDRHKQECGFISGNTPDNERRTLIKRFKGEPTGDLFTPREPLRFLCNVNVLTTGFDAPNTDCVVLLRPTNSPGLYYQMIGRGFRLADTKSDFLVLDFGENILRHGPVDQIKMKPKSARKKSGAPAKECPDCNEVVAAGYAVCPNCGHEFPPPEKGKHGSTASDAEVVSGVVSQEEHEVQDVHFREHESAKSGNLSLRVDYECGLNNWHSEWISIGHPNNWVAKKAAEWWRARSNEEVPEYVEDAVALAEAGALAPTHKITVTSVSGQKYNRITGYELGDKPPLLPNEYREQVQESPGQHAYEYDDDDIPF
jgi:DNA repair protein RadD